MPDPNELLKDLGAEPVDATELLGDLGAEPVDDGPAPGESRVTRIEPIEIKGRVPERGPLDKLSESVADSAGRMQAMAAGGMHGLTSGYSTQAEAALRWLGEQARSPFREGEAPSWEEALRQQREYHEGMKEEYPAYEAMDIAGGVGQGALLPAARGATVLQRLGAATAEGVGIGALEGAGRSQGETAGEVLEDAALGGALGGVASGVMSGVGQGVAKGVKSAGRKVRETQADLAKRSIAGSTDEAQRAASELLDQGEAGRRARRLAMEAEEPLDEPARELAGGITEQSRIDEQVREGGTRAIKRKPVAEGLREEVLPTSKPRVEEPDAPAGGLETGQPAEPEPRPGDTPTAKRPKLKKGEEGGKMAAGGLDLYGQELDEYLGARARASDISGLRATDQAEKINQRVDDTVQDIRTTLDQLEHEQGKERTTSGITAIRRAREALEGFGGRVSPDDVEGDEAEALAERFVRLDELKRKLGQFREQVDRARANPDPAVGEELESAYVNKLMPLLEDERVWGSSASQMQKRVNRAWKPYLDTVKTREWRRLHKELDTPSPTDPFGKLRETDPRDAEQLLRDVGTAKGDVPLRILRGGLESGQQLNEEMAAVFPLSEQQRELVRQGRANVDTLMKALQDREVRAEAAQQLQALERAGGERMKLGPLEFPTPPGKLARKQAQREMEQRKGRRGLPLRPEATLATAGAIGGAAHDYSESELPGDDALSGAKLGLGAAGAFRAGRGLSRASQVIRRQLTREAAKRGDQAVEAAMPEDVDSRANAKTLRQLMQEKPQLFGDALQDMQRAAQEGPAALAAEHQDQQETNPEYRRRVRRMLEEARQ